MAPSAPIAGTVLSMTEMIDGHGRPQTMVASQPSAFKVAFETKTNVKHPLAEVAV